MSQIDREIKNEADYRAALTVVSALVNADPKRGRPEADRLEVLGTLVEAYEHNLECADADDATRPVTDLKGMFGKPQKTVSIEPQRAARTRRSSAPRCGS